MKDYNNAPGPGFWHLLWQTNGIVPIALAVLTLALSFASAGDIRRAAEIDANGIFVTGTVVDRETRVLRYDDRTERTYHVTMRYPVQGAAFEHEKKVSGSTYQALTLGTEHEIRYLEGSPKVVEYRVGEFAENGATLRWGALVMGIATLGVGWYMARRVVAMLRARKFGPQEIGRVTEIETRRGSGTRRHMLKWIDAQGAAGKSLGSKNEQRYDAYPPGTEITLYRDAKGRAWWAGDVGSRA